MVGIISMLQVVVVVVVL